MDSAHPMDQLTAHLDRGWDLATRGDFARAMLSAEKSLELDAQSPEAHNLLGYIHAAEGRAEEALEHYKAALELDEGFFDAMLNAAEVLIHPLHDFEGALAMLDEALDFVENDDEIADVTLLKFDAAMHAGDRESAVKILRGLPEGPFESPLVDFRIGRARVDIGDVEGAEPFIRKAIEGDDGNAEAHYYLGRILEARGDSRGATVAFLSARDHELRLGRPPWAMEASAFEPHVLAAIKKLAPNLSRILEDALVVVSDAPGAEVVAEGVDPMLTVLLEDLPPPGKPAKVGRVFVYQRNVERVASTPEEVEEEVRQGLVFELHAAFPELGPPPAEEGEEPVRDSGPRRPRPKAESTDH